MTIKETLIDLFEGEEVKNSELKHKKFWRFMIRFVIIQALCVILMMAYIEIGHDKGWKRADVWYTCLHTHNHFPWQN